MTNLKTDAYNDITVAGITVHIPSIYPIVHLHDSTNDSSAADTFFNVATGANYKPATNITFRAVSCIIEHSAGGGGTLALWSGTNADDLTFLKSTLIPGVMLGSVGFYVDFAISWLFYATLKPSGTNIHAVHLIGYEDPNA